MEFVENYALLGVTILLALVIMIVVVWECFQKNKLAKWKLTFSLINIFVLVLCGLFYEKLILELPALKIIYYCYIIFCSMRTYKPRKDREELTNIPTLCPHYKFI